MTSRPRNAHSKARKSPAKAAETPATWMTNDGRTLFVHEMTDGHLLNTMRYLERRIEEERDKLDGAAGYAGRGEMASYYASQELHVASAFIATLQGSLESMRKEVRHRRLAADRWCVACQRFHRPNQKECRMIACRCGQRHPKPINDFHRKALGCSLS